MLIMSDLTWLTGTLGQVLLFVLLIAGSFFASGAEVAFFSLTKAEIEEFRIDQTREAQRVWHLINDGKRLLATILITNNFVNVAAILVASNLLQYYANQYGWNEELRLLLEVVLITGLLLLFGEIVPKVYAARNRRRIVSLLSFPLEVLRWFCRPLSWVLVQGTQFIDKRVKLYEESASLEDLRHAIDLTTPTSEEEKGEQDILKGIVNFSNITVRSIMRARVDVAAVDMTLPFDELIEVIREHNYSRLPVYEESLDQVRGVLHIKDLLPCLRMANPEVDLAQVMREAYFVPESKKIDALLEEFKSQHIHMAIVVDEFGGTAGIVTLEDVIEEIFGEINDEFDSEDWVYTKLSEDTYIFEGRLSLNDVRKIVGLDDQVFEDARGDSDSLGGLILELHSKIPAVGEVITYQNFEFHVESVSRNRIAMVKFVRLEEEEEERSQ
jgi:gliding motility-associated protein GldE